MNKITAAFKHKAFIPFITAGDPDLETTKTIIREIVANGADIVEIGIPFSDPVAEGPSKKPMSGLWRTASIPTIFSKW